MSNLWQSNVFFFFVFFWFLLISEDGAGVVVPRDHSDSSEDESKNVCVQYDRPRLTHTPFDGPFDRESFLKERAEKHQRYLKKQAARLVTRLKKLGPEKLYPVRCDASPTPAASSRRQYLPLFPPCRPPP